MFYTVKKNKNKIFSTIVFLAVLLSPFANTNAAINKVINYQGKLTNLSGVAVTDGTYNMEFKLYNASSTLLWTETRTGSDRVQVTSGIFSVLLGEVTALTSVDFNQTLYLGVNIGETADTPSWDGEMSPLKEIGTVPSAIVAESVLNILGGVAGSIPYQTATNTTSFASNLFWDETNSRLGIGTISPTQVLDINGKIAVNGTQVLYLPDQTSFPGTLYVGNGGDSLAHVGRSLGTNDVFVGINAGYSNTGGSRNIGIGTNSLYLNTTGNENIGIGYQTLNSNTTGGFNIAIGSGALNSNTTGGSNTVNGAESLRYLSSGSHNLALGYFAGSVIANGSTTLTTSNNSLFIGTYTKALTDTSTNEIVIGYDTTGLGSNTVVLGNSSITTTALRGNVGIGTTSPTAALHLPAGTATAETSPLKFTSGILLATPESGAIEYDGTHYYATIGNTRYQIDQQSSGGMVYPGTGIAVSTGSAWGTSISGTSSQFIKGDGSLDSNTYLTTTSAASTYVPYTGATTGVDLGSNILTTTGTGTFGNIIDSGLTSGYLPYANSSKQLTDSVIYTDGTNVGIGTTSPQNELHIFDSVNDNAFIQLGQSSTGSSSIDGFLIGVNGYERAIVWNYEDTDLRFGTNNLDRMTISNNGNIGIGTTSPTARLHLAAGTSTASTAPLKFSSGTNLSTAEAGAMEFDGTQLYFSPADSDRNILLQNSTATAFSTGSISFATDNGYLTEDNSNFYWENTNNRLGIGTNSFYSDIGSGEIPKVLVANPSDPTKIIGVGYSNTWDSGYLYASDQGDSWKNILLNPLGTGKVGINLTNPGVPLDVKGNARLGVGAATSDDYGSALYYSVDASQLNVASVIMKEHVTDNYGLEFQTYGSSSLTTKMTILGTGRVGIGTDSPTAFLHLTAGTADGGRAPLKFTSGTNLATAEAGAMEYDGTQLYFSPSTTRNILAQVSGSTALTTGSIPFATTSGYLTEDNTNFFWDDTNNRLGIGTASPLSALDVKGTLTLSGATSGYVAFAPAADAGSTTYTLPSADGLADQALTTNGSGTMAWNNISKLAQDFTVATGESITAGDVVSFINGQVKKGISATSVSIGNGASSIEYAFNSASTTYISSSTLDSTHFVVVYRDSTGYGTAIVGTVSGTTISYGSEYVFNSASTLHISATILDSTHFVVAYRDSTGYGTAIVGTVSGTTISYGSEYAFNFAGPAYISSSTLDSTHFVVAYRGTSSYGYGIIGSVSGTTISYGSEYVFNSAFISSATTSTLDSTHFVVAYTDSTDYGTAIVGTVSGTTISYGSKYVFNSASTTYISSSTLDSTHFVVAYRDGGDSSFGTAIVGTVSGTTISYGSEYSLFVKVTYTSIYKVDSTHFVVAYDYDNGIGSYYGTANVGSVSGTTITFGGGSTVNTGDSTYNSIIILNGTNTFVDTYFDVSANEGKARVGFVSGTTISYSLSINFNSGSSLYISSSTLDSTSFVVVYRDGGDSGFGTAIVGTVSGTTISYGSEYVFNSAATTFISSSTLDSTHFVVAYTDSTGYGTAIVGTVSGTTISYGSEYVFNPASTYYISLQILDSTHFVVAYIDSTGYGTAIVGTVSGTTISYGSEYVFNSASTTSISVSILDSTHFVVAYQDSTGYGTAIVGTVSGTTISYGSEYVFNSAPTLHISATILDSTHFVVAYRDNGNSDFGTAIVGTVSGTTISYGSEYVFNPASTYYISLQILDPTHFIATYIDNGNSDYGTLILGTINSTTITYGSEYVFNSASTFYNSVILLGLNFVVAYQNSTDTRGQSLLGQYSPNTSFIGIAQTSGSSTQTIKVAIQGISNIHSGLTAGNKYYVNSSGNLTTTTSSYRAGIAISSTQLLMNSYSGNSDQFFGDMIFANDFRITEGWSYPNSLIFKNQLGRDILAIDETGTLLTDNLTIGGTKLTVNSFGNVGIGTTATSALKLDVVGSSRFSGSGSSIITGSIDPIADSATVTGVGTLFTTQLAVGDRITVSGETRTVVSIVSDTELTVDTSFTDTENDLEIEKLSAIFIVQNSLGNIKTIINDLGYVGIGTNNPSSIFEIGSSDLGDGLAGPIITLGRNTNITNPGAGSINFLNKNGGAGYVWQDVAGNLRINTVAPTSINDTSGIIVGAQTSTRETKQEINDFTDYSGALTKILNAPLHTFRYINEVEGYGEDSPLAKIRLGFIADEVDSDFMVGNVIDQVSVNGLLIASIKQLSFQMQDIVTNVLGQYAKSFFSEVLVKVENGVGYMKALAIETLRIGSAENPTGITLYDETNGNPYCFSIYDGQTKTMLGECSTTTEEIETEEETDTELASSDDLPDGSPIVTLDGEKVVSLDVGSTYTEAGALATDDIDGEVAVIISGSVDTATTGTYTVTYTATDSAGNTTTVERTITVGTTTTTTDTATESDTSTESESDTTTTDTSTETDATTETESATTTTDTSTGTDTTTDATTQTTTTTNTTTESDTTTETTNTETESDTTTETESSATESESESSSESSTDTASA